MLGLGMDGAAVMSSALNGVNGLVKEKNPYTVAIHCVCHRLHLAVSQASQGVDAMNTITNIISSIYAYIMQVIFARIS